MAGELAIDRALPTHYGSAPLGPDREIHTKAPVDPETALERRLATARLAFTGLPNFPPSPDVAWQLLLDDVGERTAFRNGRPAPTGVARKLSEHPVNGRSGGHRWFTDQP